ncbi:MAG TPA: hypothetical protein VJ824_16705 [Bacillota bacterium]|nr:hypothetical protein [Bacillota bacterium]
MKRLLTLGTIALTLVAMTGCSSNSTSSAAPAGQQSSVEQQQTSPSTPAKAGNKGRMNNEELLSLLKMDEKTMQDEFKAGKSLADIADEKGVPEQQVIDLLVKQSQERTDQAVKSGKLTQEKADKMKANEQERIKQSVEHKGGFGGNGKRDAQGKPPVDQNSDTTKGSSNSNN